MKGKGRGKHTQKYVSFVPCPTYVVSKYVWLTKLDHEVTITLGSHLAHFMHLNRKPTCRCRACSATSPCRGGRMNPEMGRGGRGIDWGGGGGGGGGGGNYR